jgi:hypothetical protein
MPEHTLPQTMMVLVFIDALHYREYHEYPELKPFNRPFIAFT